MDGDAGRIVAVDRAKVHPLRGGSPEQSKGRPGTGSGAARTLASPRMDSARPCHRSEAQRPASINGSVPQSPLTPDRAPSTSGSQPLPARALADRFGREDDHSTVGVRPDRFDPSCDVRRDCCTQVGMVYASAHRNIVAIDLLVLLSSNSRLIWRSNMSVFSRTLAGALIAGLSGPATAHQSFIVLDGGHPSRASAEELVCPGPDKELRCPGYQRRISYITCDGYFCYETAQPVGGGPAPQHALNVASVATNQIASSVQPADAQYRIFFAQTLGLPGVERWVPLVDWLLQDQQGLSRAQRLGVRAINMSMGDATVSCGTPVYSAALANLASKGVRLFNATGNTSANGFSRGSQLFPNGFYFLSGQNMCGFRRSRPPIPTQAGRGFRRMSATPA